MGLIREPKGVDLIVAPSIFTEEDKRMISEIISNYKLTGELPLKDDRSSEKGIQKNIEKIASGENKRDLQL